MIISGLYIGTSGKRGKGVFTSVPIASNVLVEIAPVIVMSKEERKLLDQTRLHDYIFEWGDNREQCCMALGYASVYNHSFRSNCEYEMDFEKNEMYIRTVAPIEKDAELFINYNGDFDDTTPLWFEAQ
jgi:SET domain-containing protein